MSDEDAENWSEIYKNAVMELGHAKMRGGVGDARAQIRTRVEKLKEFTRPPRR